MQSGDSGTGDGATAPEHDQGAAAEPEQATVGVPIGGSPGGATSSPDKPLMSPDLRETLAASTPPTPTTPTTPTTSGTSSRGFGGRSIPGLRFGPVLFGLVLAVAWFFIGGLPFADHDEYGFVPITTPGEKLEPAPIDLPGGDVYVYFEESGLSENDSADAPPDLTVAARPAGAGKKAEPVAIEDVPGFLFSSQTDDTGWEPHGKLDAPEGRYLFTAQASSSFGRVSIGNPPINPFGPPIVGAILILAVGVGITVLVRSRA